MILPNRVLVTRASHQGSDLADRLLELGLQPVQIPTIAIEPPSTWAPLDAALREIDSFHWLLFTSANAVAAFATIRTERQLKLRAKIAAIGAATARSLVSIGLEPDVVPSTAVAESLAEALRPHARQPGGGATRFLLLRAEEGRDALPEALRVEGAEVTIAPVYRTIVRTESIDLLRELFHANVADLVAITFTSSSTARNFYALCDAAGLLPPPTVLRVSIGPITSATMRELGYPPHAEAPEPSVAALARTVLDAVRANPRSTFAD